MSKTPRTYYDILKLDPAATDEEVKAAYRRMAMIFHPDRNPDKRSLAEQRFQQINEAYAALKTKAKRNAYNHEIKKQQAKARKVEHANTNTGSNDRSIFSQLAGALWASRSDGSNR